MDIWRVPYSGLHGILLLTIAMVTSMAVMPVVWRYAGPLGLIDLPDPRKVHMRPVPRIGGWGICLGTLLPLLLLVPFDAIFKSYLIGCGILFAFGLADDIKEINHYTKFVGQIAAAAVVVYVGDLWVYRFPFIGLNDLPPEVGKPFTIFALVGVIHAINHSDGLDGLAAGEALLTMVVVSILAYQADGLVAFPIALACIGGLLGFLRFNTHPARIFMGDTGSEFLGFTVGFLVILLTQGINTAVSPAVALLLIGLPIVDILAVLVQRISQGMNWFRASRNHIHHRLLDLQFDHYETVVIIYFIQAALVLGSIVMKYESDWLITGYYLGVCSSVLIALTILEKRYARGAASTRTSGAVATLGTWLQAAQNIKPFSFIVAAFVPCYVILSIITIDKAPISFGALAGLALLMALVELYFRAWRSGLVTSVAIYLSVMLAVSYGNLDAHEIVPLFEEVFFAVLAIAIAIVIKFEKENEFRTTPTDYLIVLGVIAIAMLTRETLETRDFVIDVIKVIILLYGCEVLINRARGKIRELHTVVPRGRGQSEQSSES